MPRPKIYTEEELKERIRASKRKYNQSKKGKEVVKEANKKYQQTENYKNYKSRYYHEKKNEEPYEYNVEEHNKYYNHRVIP